MFKLGALIVLASLNHCVPQDLQLLVISFIVPISTSRLQVLHYNSAIPVPKLSMYFTGGMDDGNSIFQLAL
jgi:hypothetical protein